MTVDCPTGKFPYPTKAAAREHGAHLRKRNGPGRTIVAWYLCTHCGAWHLTSRRVRKRPSPEP